MGIINALNNRPVRVLGFLTALHSLIFGVGYLSGWGGFNGALVGLEVNNLLITGALGAALTSVGSLLMFAYSRMNPKTIRGASFAQANVWLFVTLLYLVNGAYLLALGVGATWLVLSLYIAFASANRQNIIAYDKTPQAVEDTKNEDTL